MNQQEFEQIFDNLTDRRREVLEQVMLGQTDTAIANSMGIKETTVRKHIERICEEFGLDDDNQEGRRYRRSDLVALLAKHKPELMDDRTFKNTKNTKEMIVGEIANNTSIISVAPVSVSGARYPKGVGVAPSQVILEEYNKLSFPRLPRESAEELLNKEFAIYADEQQKIQRAKTLNQIGYDHYLEGDFQTASFYLQWATRFYPEMGLAHYNLALTFERLSDLSQAREHYEIAMKQSNRAAVSATNNLARLEIRQKNPEAAVRLIEPILLRAQDPAVKASLYKNLGWAYYELKRYKEAKENLLKSIEFRIDYAPAYYLLGKVQELIDDKESALSSFREFLKYDDNQPKTIGKEWRVPELEDWYFEVVKYLKEHSK